MTEEAEARARILAASGVTEEEIAALEAGGFGQAWQQAREAEARFREVIAAHARVGKLVYADFTEAE